MHWIGSSAFKCGVDTAGAECLCDDAMGATCLSAAGYGLQSHKGLEGFPAGSCNAERARIQVLQTRSRKRA